MHTKVLHSSILMQLATYSLLLQFLVHIKYSLHKKTLTI